MAATVTSTGEPAAFVESAESIRQHLGPYAIPFIQSCYEANAPRFLFLWGTGALAACVAVGIALVHKNELFSKQPSMQRMYYNQISWFAPVLGMAAACSLFCPRVFLMMKMCQEFTEALALAAFGNVLFLLCADEAHSEKYEGDNMGKQMLAGLNNEGPKPHFAVPPFGCCFVKCCPHILLKPWHLLLARNFIRQYATIVVVGSLVSMWCALAMDPSRMHTVRSWISMLTKLAAFVCIYGLFILYKASHNLLHHWNPTTKFISLKLVVVLMAYQELMIKLAIKHLSPAGTHCLAVEGVTGELATELQNQNREHFNSMYFVALESILVAYLVRRAFPASELKTMDAQIHGKLIEMDLEQMGGDKRGILDCEAESEGETQEETSVE